VTWDPGAVRSRGRIAALARLVRIEHTLFSLPFAYAGAFLAAIPTPWEALLIFTAVLGLRTAAMAYNNIADLDIDSKNPRTVNRPLVKGEVSLRDAWLLVAAGSALYYASALLLNQAAACLSPLLWLVALSYPHAKRYHCLPHLHLGLALGLVVFGGYVAVAGGPVSSLYRVIATAPWLLVVAVALWVAGFDTLYAAMDLEFDRREGLGSIPACYGEKVGLLSSIAMEAGFLTLLVISYTAYRLGPPYLASVAAAALLETLQYIYYSRGLHGKAFNVNLATGLIVAAGIICGKLIPQ